MFSPCRISIAIIIDADCRCPKNMSVGPKTQRHVVWWRAEDRRALWMLVFAWKRSGPAKSGRMKRCGVEEGEVRAHFRPARRAVEPEYRGC
jgi:hypothetical protein